MAMTVRQYAKATGKKVKVSYGSNGRSSSGGSSSGGSSSGGSSSGGSSSGGSSKPVKTYVDKFGVVRREGQTGFNQADYQKATASGFKGKSGEPSVRFVSKNAPEKRTSAGVIVDRNTGVRRYYTNLTKQELAFNRLSPKTRAVLDTSRTRILQAKGTSRDLFKVASAGKKTAELGAIAQQLRVKDNALRRLEEERIKAEKLKEVPVLTASKLRELAGKREYTKKDLLSDLKLFTDSRGRVIGIQDPYAQMSYRLEGPMARKDVLNYLYEQQAQLAQRTVAKKVKAKKEYDEKYASLNKKYKKISEDIKSQDKWRKTYQDKVGVVTDTLVEIGKINPLTRLVPKKGEVWVKGVLKNIATIPYDLTVGLTRFVPSATQQVLFQVEAVGFKEYGTTVLNNIKSWDNTKEVLKQFDIRTPEGFANLISIYLFVKAGKAIKTRSVKKVPKRSNAKVGTVFKDANGVKGIVTKGGRVVKLSKSQSVLASINELFGKKARVKRTATARAVKKAQKTTKLTLKEKKLIAESAKKKTKLQINKEANTLSKRYGLNKSESSTFRRLYSKFRKNPNKANTRALKKFENKVSIDQIVRSIDKKILARKKVPKKTKRLGKEFELELFKNVEEKGTWKTYKVKADAKYLKKLGFKQKDLSKLNKLINKDLRLKTNKNAIYDYVIETINKRNKTLFTKKTTTNPEEYLKSKGIKVRYLSEKTLGKDVWGKTNGKTVWLRDVFKRPSTKKGIYYRGKPINLKQFKKIVLNHEAIHTVKDFGKWNKFLKKVIGKRAENSIAEFRTRLLENSKFKFKAPKRKTSIKAQQTRAKFKKAGTTKKEFLEYSKYVKSEAKKLGATKNQIKKITSLSKELVLGKKGAKKKINKIFEKLKTSSNKKIQKKAISKADSQARRKGFKDYKEQFKYEEAFKKYKDGNLKFEKTLRSIEKAMASRKLKASKLASKRYSQLRKQLAKEANQLLREGRLRIRDKKYVVRRPKTRKMMSKSRAESLAMEISQKYKKLEETKYNKQAKEVLKEILRGNQVEMSDPKLVSAVKRLLNRQRINALRTEKRLLIQAGKVKGKMPKTSIGKKAKRKLKLKSKAETRVQRIARKKAKRSFAGDAQARKIYRKQIVEKLRSEKVILERIMRGDPKLAKLYTIEIDRLGRVFLKPRAGIPKNVRIKTASQIIKKARIPKKSIQKKSNGQIQLLETKKIKVTKKTKQLSPLERIGIKKAELERIWREVGRKYGKTARPRPSGLKTKIKFKAPKGKPRIVSKSIPKTKLKILTATTVATGLNQISKVRIKLAQRTSQSLKQIPAQIQKLTQKQALVQEQKIGQILEQAQALAQDIAIVQDQVVNQKQDQALKQNKKIINKLILKLKTTLKKIKKVPEEVTKGKKKKKLDWRKEAPRGYNYLVQPYIKSRGAIRKLGKPTTKNLGLNRASSYADNNLVRSMQIKITGLTKRKDKRLKSLKKFRKKISKDPMVLLLVEKNKYTFDRAGEKRQARLSRKSRKKPVKRRRKKR